MDSESAQREIGIRIPASDSKETMNGIVSVVPEFGVNYNMGIGFSYQDNSFVSKGIAVTRWNRGRIQMFLMCRCPMPSLSSTRGMQQPQPIVHRLPALPLLRQPHVMSSSGSRSSGLRAWERIAVSQTRLGSVYDYSLVAGHALSDTFLGKALGLVTFGWSTKMFRKIWNRKNSYICSVFLALALQDQPELKKKGILKKKACEIDPQALFQDGIVFKPWVTVVKGETIA
jgi:hypothetical protein